MSRTVEAGTAPSAVAGAPGRAPTLLAVASELPWPPVTGGRLRTFHLLRGLGRSYRIRLVTAVPVGGEADVEALRRHGIEVLPVPAAPRRWWAEAGRALSAMVLGEPYVLYRRHDRRAVRAAMRAEARREPPDALYLDHLDSHLYRSAAPGTPAVVDMHNVYSVLAMRASQDRRNPLLRAYLRREAALLGRAERRAALDAALVQAVSEGDADHFRRLGGAPVSVVPNGVDCAAYEGLPAGRPGGRPIILCLGTLSWPPNARAAAYLAREVLPRLRRPFPGLCLRIVGRGPTREVRALGRVEGVELVADAPDVLPHLRDASMLAVPLEVGGGTRLKILEAFAAGLPVVSTPVGCEGLLAVPGEHLVVRELDGIESGIAELLSDSELGRSLAERARAFAREHYDWRAIAERACAGIAPLVGA